jgi:hypothetical protein
MYGRPHVWAAIRDHGAVAAHVWAAIGDQGEVHPTFGPRSGIFPAREQVLVSKRRSPARRLLIMRGGRQRKCLVSGSWTETQPFSSTIHNPRPNPSRLRVANGRT